MANKWGDSKLKPLCKTLKSNLFGINHVIVKSKLANVSAMLRCTILSGQQVTEISSYEFFFNRGGNKQYSRRQYPVRLGLIYKLAQYWPPCSRYLHALILHEVIKCILVVQITVSIVRKGCNTLSCSNTLVGLNEILNLNRLDFQLPTLWLSRY